MPGMLSRLRTQRRALLCPELPVLHPKEGVHILHKLLHL